MLSIEENEVDLSILNGSPVSKVSDRIASESGLDEEELVKQDQLC